jgi:6-pyruvoyltetrahydropterin/6-carboxytetrahydropterin synthase
MGGMEATRRLTVERNRLRFAAAHMATFRGECEPLHGHNYDVMVELEGALTEESWVWDFGEVKRETRAIADELDHRFLLQRESKQLDITEMPESWVVAFGPRRYEFPKSDVAVLPIDNSTVERLSEWFAGRLRAKLRELGATNVRKLTVGIEEMPGQAGWYTVEVESLGGQ